MWCYYNNSYDRKRLLWASIAASNIQTGTGSSAASLHTTMAAGTTLFLNVTAITLTSGLAVCYYDQVI